jgi:hypothetical protein
VDKGGFQAVHLTALYGNLAAFEYIVLNGECLVRVCLYVYSKSVI